MEQADWLAVAEYKKAVGGSISPDEISHYYGAHAADLAEMEVQIAAIRTKSGNKGAGLSAEETRQKTAALRKALAAGEDTQAMNARFGVPDAVAVKTQIYARGDLPQDQEEKIFGLAPGATVELQEGEGATILIHAVRRIQPTLQEVSAKIESRLRREKFQRLVNGLLNANHIWIDQKYFNALAAGQS
jgi:hypothetical protein